jgi:hypothetical protein
MEQQEKNRIIENLDEIKKIRLNIGSTFYMVSSISFMVIAMVFYSQAIFLLPINWFIRMMIFTVFGATFEILSLWIMHKGTIKQEEFLRKHD